MQVSSARIRVYTSRGGRASLCAMLRSGSDSLIQFFCVDPDHAVPDGADQLTIHEGKWAFCRRGRLGQEHRWEPTGGLVLGEIATFARARTPVDGGARRSASGGTTAQAD